MTIPLSIKPLKWQSVTFWIRIFKPAFAQFIKFISVYKEMHFNILLKKRAIVTEIIHFKWKLECEPNVLLYIYIPRLATANISTTCCGEHVRNTAAANTDTGENQSAVRCDNDVIRSDWVRPGCASHVWKNEAAGSLIAPWWLAAV